MTTTNNTEATNTEATNTETTDTEATNTEQPGATHDGPDAAHVVPEGVSDATVEALGTLSAAVEVLEHARGLLYGFHRLTGTADLNLGEAVDQLREAGHTELADRIDTELVGRNVIDGRWTFQIVEDYDDNYYALAKELERTARDQLVGGKRHLYEANMKEDRRTAGRRRHEAKPADLPD